MVNFKRVLIIVVITIIAISFANCKGEEKQDNMEVSDTETLDISDESEISLEMPSVEDPSMVATESETSGSENYDKMLDDYDEYVTEYVKFYKKAMKGDQSAMSDYPAMMEKAANLQESMEKAQSNNQLSSSQIARMTKIQAKMLQAMQ